MDWESEEQKSQDKADFQAAFRGIDPDFVNEEMTSGLMWTGSIMDAAPSYRADKELDIYSPSVAFVNSANGVFNTLASCGVQRASQSRVLVRMLA